MCTALGGDQNKDYSPVCVGFVCIAYSVFVIVPPKNYCTDFAYIIVREFFDSINKCLIAKLISNSLFNSFLLKKHQMTNNIYFTVIIIFNLEQTFLARQFQIVTRQI